MRREVQRGQPGEESDESKGNTESLTAFPAWPAAAASAAVSSATAWSAAAWSAVAWSAAAWAAFFAAAALAAAALAFFPFGFFPFPCPAACVAAAPAVYGILSDRTRQYRKMTYHSDRYWRRTLSPIDDNCSVAGSTVVDRCSVRVNAGSVDSRAVAVVDHSSICVYHSSTLNRRFL